MKASLFLIIFLFATGVTNAQQYPEELGKISWIRNYSEALKLSKQQDKPIVLLFQEVPGCATCRNYGNNVLSNGLIVDAIENEFIPLAIHNNKGGHDADVLELYGEPSWNNPVVRIIDKNGDNIIKRISGKYSQAALVEGLVKALSKQKIEVPLYLELLNAELNSDLEERHYQMYCFWSGESHIGAIEGVIKTSPGFMSGHEVVKVDYDKNKISLEKLDDWAKKANCAPIKKSSFRLDKDEQYYLKNSIYQYLPLTNSQRTKINSALAKNSNPLTYLSPSQRNWLIEIKDGKRKRNAIYTHELNSAWWQM